MAAPRRKAPQRRPARPARKSTTVELTISLPGALHASLKARAAHEDRSMTALIRVVLRDYLEGVAGDG